MRTLHLDIETYCELELNKVGVFKYVRHKSFEIILLSYRYTDELFTTTIDLDSGEEIPEQVVEDICSPEVRKKAWNVFFEFTCFKKHIKKHYIELPTLEFVNWFCTMTKAAYNGLPLKLESAATALKLGLGKMTEGKALIKYFCTPVKKPKKKDGYRTRNRRMHAPEKWEQFKKYNNIDVDVEVEIDHSVPVELPEYEQDLFFLDYHITAMGITVDLAFVRQAVALVKEHFDKLIDRSRELTGLMNPNSVAQLKEWYEYYTGQAVKSLNADTIEKILKRETDPVVREVLTIRQELSLSSVKKYAVMLKMADKYGVVRGLTQFYAANRTGRWAGRGIQVHNLPGQSDYKPKQITIMRDAIHSTINRDMLSMMFSDVLATLKLLIRTAFIPRPGHYFVIADWSAIEARILAWLSNCKWRMDVFASHGKIYEASIAKMLGVPIESITKESKERKKGKVSELALGYQGWTGALIRMGALDMGLSMEELPTIAGTWRLENPEIAHRERGLWARCQKAFLAAFEYPGKVIRFADGRLTVQYKASTLIFTLPSGRQLFYPNARCVNGEISYYGVNQTSKKLQKQSLYGGKITENAVQAIARDVLAEGIKGVSRELAVVMHIHDELVIEVPETRNERDACGFVDKIMTKTPGWAPGLILKCDIFTSPYYRKN
jgi:DNA polymerase bacteriophage-type